MAARPFWKGYMKLSLVTCPVAMMAATSEEEKVRFHVLNRRTGNRIFSQYVDAGTGKPVDEANEIKGYARGEDDYVLLDDEELESIELESVRTIDIQTFVPAESIDWIWYDTPYYLTPDDPIGEEAYCVIRDAMRSTTMVGVSRLVLHRRERAVILKPRDNGIVLWTLRFGEEVRDPGEYFASIRDVKPDKELMRLIGDLIKSRKKAWSPGIVSDPVRERLLDIIEAKKKGAGKAEDSARGGGGRAGAKQRHQHHGCAAAKRSLSPEAEGALMSAPPIIASGWPCSSCALPQLAPQRRGNPPMDQRMRKDASARCGW